jgi:phage shock protein PspC (stress-responsive transcriptional regulator)
MNKTHNINLGGVPFIIDEEAFYRLDHYLKALENHFSRSESKEEILGDIEARIAEIFQNGMNNKKIVEELDVVHAIEIMGTPDDFQDEDYEVDEEEKAVPRWDLKTGKKLYRDPEDKVIGGVCSGLAAYFGLEEPIWVRIAFAFVFFTMGFGLILYLIMWAILPEAKTASDRLAMRGENVNVDSIAKNIESGFDTISGKIQEIKKDFQSKKKRQSGKKEPDDFRATTAERVSILAKNTRSKIEAGSVTTALRTVLLVIAIVLLIALFAIWIGVLTGSVAFGHVTSFLVPWTGILSYIAIVPFVFLIGVPLFSIARGIIRTLRPSPVKRKRTWVGTGLIIASVIGLFAIVNLTINSMKDESTVTTEVMSFSTGTATLEVDMFREVSREKSLNTDFGSLGKDHVSIRDIDLSLTKSVDDQYHIIQHVKARGANHQESKHAATSIDYPIEINEEVLKLSDAFTITKPNKYRAQQVKIEIQVPEDGTIKFDKTSLFKIACGVFPEHELHKELIGHTFKMGSEKLDYFDSGETPSDIGMNE